MEVAKPDAASSPSTTEAETYRRDDDPIVIPAHVFNPPPKITVEAEFEDLKKYLLTPEDGRALKEAEDYISALKSARESVVAVLHADSGIDTHGNIDSALQKYVALLLGLVNRGPAKGTASDTPLLETKIGADSKLRSSVTFTWQDVLQVNKEAVAARDGLFELASLLVSSGVWRMRRAYDLCSAQPAAVAADAAAQAHKMLRSAAGMFSFTAAQCSNILFNAVPSMDIHPEVLKAYESVCLGDAQAITVLRAIAKGNAPKLVAELAADTAELYRQAANASGRAVPPPGTSPATSPAPSALTAYANWKALAFDAYAYAFAGQSLMVEKSEARNQAGRAVRLLEEALSKLAAATQACPDAKPKARGSRSTADHGAFDSALESCVKTAHAKIKRENDVIYYQKVPADLPEVPAGRRLVAATTYALPAVGKPIEEGVLGLFGLDTPPISAQIVGPLPAPAAGGKPGEAAGKPAGEEEVEAGQASCWRWLLVIIAAPILVIISLVGAIVWLVLLPVKIVCCPIGCAAQLVWNAVEWGLKAPFRALLWASGKPWRPQPPERDRSDPEAPPHREAKPVAS